MAIINIGTTTNATATAYQSQRKIVKTTTGILVLFANTGTTIQYKTSSDNGLTWSESWINAFTTGTSYSFDVYIDTTNDIYLTINYLDGNFRLAFRKLTYVSATQTWSLGTSVLIVAGIGDSHPSFAKKSDGSFFISYRNGTTDVRTYFSINEGVSWATAGTLALASASSQLIAVGTEIWCFIQRWGYSSVHLFKYSTSWGTGTTIIASGVTSASTSLGVGLISPSEIYLSVRTSSGIRIYKYNGSTWDSGTLLSNHSNDTTPSISIVGGYPVVVWSDYTGTYYNIAYRKWNGTSWVSQVDITSDAAVDFFPNCIAIDNLYLFLSFMSGAGSPYTIYFDKVLIGHLTQTILSDTKIKALDVQKTILSDSKVVTQSQKNLLSDSKVVIQFSPTILSDTKIKVLDVQKTILSDAEISSHVYKYLLSDSTVKIADIQKTILSNANINYQSQENLLSDATINIVDIQKTILSDAICAIEALYNINNKVSFSQLVLSDIVNKFSFVKQELKNITSMFGFVKQEILDLTNDIRTHKLVTNDMLNDVRFLATWQVAGAAGFQSLGKTYIRVYINSVEQTTVDVDSISIDRILDGEHTASFNLGKTYDSVKPIMEQLVEIKYNDWVIYKGYITTITPGDSPESITIGCKDIYWKNNRTNKYFFVGNTPKNNTELYYNTIATALTTAFSWTPGIGNFVPDEIGCFAVGESTAITNLITQCGNYSFYYDVTEIKQLWIAGQGSIIDLDRQVIGNNLGLYDVISHQTRESVDGLINKYRVQMGDKIIKRLSNTGGESYTAYYYQHIGLTAIPDWDSSYETLAIDSGTGFGYDYHKPEDNWKYKDVYLKYSLGRNLLDYESWTDEKPVQVEIFSRGSSENFKEGLLDEGYTIDYAKSSFTLNTPLYCYEKDEHGKAISTRSPIIFIDLWKKSEYNVTLNPTDDPETDITNPLMFFTDKMGIYPTTIIEDLNLSNLSIQVGGIITNLDGTKTIVSSWDDTLFATDFANWKLSNICDKKIQTSIEVTLDCLCFNNIDLKNRIYIDGITEAAMNIKSISIDISSFICRIDLENSRYFNRVVSLMYRGD